MMDTSLQGLNESPGADGAPACGLHSDLITCSHVIITQCTDIYLLLEKLGENEYGH